MIHIEPAEKYGGSVEVNVPEETYESYHIQLHITGDIHEAVYALAVSLQKALITAEIDPVAYLGGLQEFWLKKERGDVPDGETQGYPC